MGDMKWDMGGAGVVTGLMKALAGRKAKVNAVGVIGLVENMPSGTATRPGDVVTSLFRPDDRDPEHPTPKAGWSWPTRSGTPRRSSSPRR